MPRPVGHLYIKSAIAPEETHAFYPRHVSNVVSREVDGRSLTVVAFSSGFTVTVEGSVSRVCECIENGENVGFDTEETRARTHTHTMIEAPR